MTLSARIVSWVFVASSAVPLISANCPEVRYSSEELVLLELGAPDQATVNFPGTIRPAASRALLALFQQKDASRFGEPVEVARTSAPVPVRIIYKVPIPLGKAPRDKKTVAAKAKRLADAVSLLQEIAKITPTDIPDRLVKELGLSRGDLGFLTDAEISTDGKKAVSSIGGHAFDLSSVVVSDTLLADIQTTPSDPEFPKECGLRAIHAEKAWTTINAISGSVKIAVVDTGLADHPDLPHAKRGNNTTDVDENGHGTAVAGVIGAESGSIGIVGVVWDASMTAYRFLDRNGRGYVTDAYDKINTAVAQGANIIVLPWGVRTYDDTLQMVLASHPNVLFVAPAGNNGGDACQDPVYPAAFDLDNVISVMATTCDDTVPRFSNYGANVDIAAPGEGPSRNLRIYSTVLHQRWGNLAGTSMSAAYVGGAAALVLQRSIAQGAQCTPAEIKEWLKRTGEKLATLDEKNKDEHVRRLNLAAAVEKICKP